MLNNDLYINDDQMNNDQEFPYQYKYSNSDENLKQSNIPILEEDISSVVSEYDYTYTPTNISNHSYKTDNIQLNTPTHNNCNNSYKTKSNTPISQISGFNEEFVEPYTKNDKFYINNVLLRESLFEFIGMYIFIILGQGITSNIILYNNLFTINFNQWFYHSIGWGISLMFGTFIALIGNNNGFLNPAITFSMFLLHKIDKYKLLYYTIAQFIGAFIGSLTTYLLNFIKIEDITYIENTANIFITYKEDTISITTGFFLESIMMFFYTIIFLSINFYTHKDNITYSKYIGYLFIILSLSLGFNTKIAINPARDFGSRLFTMVTPWYTDVYTYNNYWFWIPIIAPYIGTFIGYCIFYLFIFKQKI
jgi:glycerol uptake facilitator-like aquaporin